MVVCVSRFFQRFVLVLGIAICLILGFGFLLNEYGWFGVRAGSGQDGAYREMRVYADVLRKIQSDYVTSPNMGDVTTGALHGLLESLDADSSYLTPTEYKIYKERPATGVAQIGVTVSKRFGYATVVNVLPGSPADVNHIDDGDVIESIGSQSTRDLSLAVIRLMLEGKPGSTVELSLVRPYKPDPAKLTITRAVTPTPALAEQQYEGSSILYLKPGALTEARVSEMAGKIKAAGKEKILLDLRDVSGDDELQGIRLANFFVKQGTLATLAGQKFPSQTFAADPVIFLTDTQVAVLVNHGTFGAAELAAGILGDLKRADVVGDRTFGEGSLQKTIEMPDGAALMLTVAKYQIPSGAKIQDVAVTPGVAVAQPNGDDDQSPAPHKGDDTLSKGLELLKNKS